MTGSAVRYGSAGTMAYEQWQKIKIREEEAIGKLTKKKKQKGKQRYHFDDKGPYSQNYGFSSSHLWM